MSSTHLLITGDDFWTILTLGGELRHIADLRWIGDEFEACRKNWRRFQSSWSDDWTIERQIEAFSSSWVECESNMRVKRSKMGELSRNEKRERIWNRTRRILRFGEASRLLNTWLITDGDAWGTSHGGLGGYQPADTMVSQQHLESPLMEGWYFNFKYHGG